MSRLPDPMKVDTASLTKDELIVHFELLRSKVRNQEEDLAQLKNKSFGKAFLKMFVAVMVSLLMLFSGLLYTYAINKLTGTPPDSGAISLLYFAIAIYVISVLLQLVNTGGK